MRTVCLILNRRDPLPNQKPSPEIYTIGHEKITIKSHIDLHFEHPAFGRVFFTQEGTNPSFLRVWFEDGKKNFKDFDGIRRSRFISWYHLIEFVRKEGRVE